LRRSSPSGYYQSPEQEINVPKLGQEVKSRNAPPSAATLTDTNTAFMIGLTDQGTPGLAVECTSLAEFEAAFGPPSTTNLLFNEVDVFLREEGQTVYVSRKVGPGTKAATIVLKDSEAKPTLAVTAKSDGAYANGWKAVVTEESTEFALTIQNAKGETLEKHTKIKTRQEATELSWLYVAVTLSGTSVKNPEKGTFELTGGTDERAAITGAEIKKCAEEALAGFANLEPAGQVLDPGNTTTGVHEALLNHCAEHEHNRVALIQLAKGTEAEVLAAMAAAAALPNAEYGMAVVGSLGAPGVAPATERKISGSTVVAALCARGDATGSPNVAPCGLKYPLRYCTSTDSDFGAEARQTLFNAGANTFHLAYGILSLWGFQSLVPESTSTVYDQFNHTRTRMAIKAKGALIDTEVLFGDIDEKYIADYNTRLTVMLRELATDGALYPLNGDAGFAVNTGPAVNTQASIEKQEVKAILEVRYSPYASFAAIELISVPSGQALSE
jgi:hypothetical protein